METLWKLFWSFVLAIMLIGAASLGTAFTCYATGCEFDIEDIKLNILLSTVWLVAYILIDKNE